MEAKKAARKKAAYLDDPEPDEGGGAGAAESAEVVSDWKEATAEDGRVYWSNEVTSETTWEEPPDLIVAKEAAAAASPSKPKTNAAEAAVAAANHAKHQADRAAKQRSPLKPGKKNSPVKKKK